MAHKHQHTRTDYCKTQGRRPSQTCLLCNSEQTHTWKDDSLRWCVVLWRLWVFRLQRAVSSMSIKWIHLSVAFFSVIFLMMPCCSSLHCLASLPRRFSPKRFFPLSVVTHFLFVHSGHQPLPFSLKLHLSPFFPPHITLTALCPFLLQP